MQTFYEFLGDVKAAGEQISRGGERRPDPVQARQAAAEALLDRAVHLSRAERLLLEAVYRHGRSAADIAALLDAEPRSVRRWVQRLVRRLNSGRSDFVLGHAAAWGSERRRVAISVLVRGLSIREAAEELGLSIHAVRHHRAAVLAMWEMSREGARA